MTARTVLPWILLSCVVALSGCDQAVTLQSMEGYAPDPSPPIPDLSGLWAPVTRFEDIELPVIRIASDDYDVDACRSADITLVPNDPDQPANRDIPYGDRLCFMSFGDLRVVEVRTGQFSLYQPFLFRGGGDSFAICGMSGSLWVHAISLARNAPGTVSMAGVDMVTRDAYGRSLTVVTSSGEKLAAWFASNVSQLEQSCDKETSAEEGNRSRGWIEYRRISTPRKPPTEQ